MLGTNRRKRSLGLGQALRINLLAASDKVSYSFVAIVHTVTWFWFRIKCEKVRFLPLRLKVISETRILL